VAEETHEAHATGAMRERWREFARRDPLHYVAANRDRWEADDFYAMGAELAAEVLAWSGDGIGRERMLEIGCGAGRMLVHFAPEFEHVIGVDIAPEMVELARRRMPANVELALVDGANLSPIADSSVDLALSVQVFQHVPERAVIASYVEEAARVLRPGGRAAFQFDTRPNPPLRRLLLRLPDRLLPRDRRRYIRRYPLPAGWPAEAATKAGLRVVGQRGSATEDHFVLLERSAAA
jgi:SAM-dependent methyltransferase